jgi:RNA polymerase sigma-70 factor (ECF subfamily)
LAALYREHYGPVAGYVYRRVGDVHVAEDLVAEVFLTVVRSLRRYQHRGVPFRAWLYRIATNTVNRWARRRRRQAVHELLQPSRAAVARGDANPRKEPDAGVARMAMLALPPRYQSVLALHYFEGLSVDEVAATLDCRIGTVKSRLSRARQALRDRLEHGR